MATRASKPKRPTTRRKPPTRAPRKAPAIARARPRVGGLAGRAAAISAVLDDVELEEAKDARDRHQEVHPRTSPTKADRQLVAAAGYGGIDDATRALAAGASPDARNDDGQTALYRAMSVVSGQRGSVKKAYTMVEFLLAQGADPNATVVAALRVGMSRRAVEISPLRRAIDENLRTIQALLKRHGGRDVYRPLT